MEVCKDTFESKLIQMKKAAERRCNFNQQCHRLQSNTHDQITCDQKDNCSDTDSNLGSCYDHNEQKQDIVAEKVSSAKNLLLQKHIFNEWNVYKRKKCLQRNLLMQCDSRRKKMTAILESIKATRKTVQQSHKNKKTAASSNKQHQCLHSHSKTNEMNKITATTKPKKQKQQADKVKSDLINRKQKRKIKIVKTNTAKKKAMMHTKNKTNTKKIPPTQKNIIRHDDHIISNANQGLTEHQRNIRTIRANQSQLAKMHHVRNCMIYRGWIPWMQRIEKRKLLQCKAQKHYEFVLLIKMYSVWKSVTHLKKIWIICGQKTAKRCNLIIVFKHKQIRKRNDAFEVWKELAKEYKLMHHHLTIRLDYIRTRWYWNQIMFCYQQRMSLKMLEIHLQNKLCDNHYNVILKKRFVKKWKKAIQLEKQNNLKKIALCKVNAWLEELRKNDDFQSNF